MRWLHKKTKSTPKRSEQPQLASNKLTSVICKTERSPSVVAHVYNPSIQKD